MSEHPQPKISVVIPTYNRRSALVEALRSVLAQTLQPSEIIVVDDCSTDGTNAASIAAVEPNIRYIRNSKNLGGGGSRNAGVRAANGTWIAFLDSDDLWLPTKLERQMQAYEQRNAEVAILASNVIWRRPAHKDRPLNHRAPHALEHTSSYLMVSDQALQTSTLVVRKELLLQVPFNEALRKHQDWDLILRLQHAGARMMYLHEPLAIYRADDDPKRISVAVRDVGVSTRWMDDSASIIAHEAAAYYYAYRCLPRALRADSSLAISTLARFAFRSSRSAIYTARALGRLSVDAVTRLMPEQQRLRKATQTRLSKTAT